MTFALAALFTLLPQVPEPPRARTSDKEIAAIVARLLDTNRRDDDADVAKLQATGIAGVRFLCERAVALDPDTWGWPILPGFEPKGARIGEDILSLFRHADERVRPWAALALANTMPPVVDLFLGELESSDRERKLGAVRAARGMMEHYEAVAPKLAEFVDDADPEVRYWATFALGGLAPASLPALYHALESKDELVRAAAAEAIQKSCYPYFTNKKSSDWGGYSTWHGLPPAMRLRGLTNDALAREGIEPLRKALKDTNPDVRFFAAMTLYEIGPQAAAARAELEALRDDPSPGVRVWAAATLERTDPSPWARLKLLAARLRTAGEKPAALDDDAFTRCVVDLDARFQWLNGQSNAPQVQWTDEVDTRYEATCKLAKHNLEPLLESAASADAAQSAAATKILTAMDRELLERIRKLIRILDDEMGPGKASAALVELGPVAMPELEHELLRFPRFPMGSPTYYEISKVFEKIGEPSLPALAVGLNHWRDCGRVFSTMTLMALREKSAPMTPAVVSAWRSVGTDERVPGTDTRWDSRKEKFYDGYSSEPSNTRGMKRFGPEAIPTLIRALDDPHGNVRMRAATALGSFESVAKSALPALVRRLNDDQRYVAQAAAEAILLIVPVDAPEAGAARAKLGTK